MEKLGIFDRKCEDGENLAGKLTFKHQVVNKKSFYEINHHHSHHCKALQRSRYIMVEDDMTRLRQQFEIQTEAAQQELQKTEVIGGGGAGVNHQKRKTQNQLIISFCRSREVN